MQRETAGECPEGQRGRTVNPLAYAFVGSSPTSPTSLRAFGASAGEPRAKARPPKPLDRRSPSSGAGGRRGQAFDLSYGVSFACGCSSMVEQQPSKLMTRVRFPSPAPNPHSDTGTNGAAGLQVAS